MRDSNGYYKIKRPYLDVVAANACLAYLVGAYNTDLQHAWVIAEKAQVIAQDLRCLAILNIVGYTRLEAQLRAAPTGSGPELALANSKIFQLENEKRKADDAKKKADEESEFYYAQCGVLTLQVADAENDIRALESEKSVLEGKLAADKDKVRIAEGALAAQKTALDAQIAALQSELGTVKSDNLSLISQKSALEAERNAAIAQRTAAVNALSAATAAASTSASTTGTFTAVAMATMTAAHDAHKARADKAEADLITAEKDKLEAERLKGVAELDLAASKDECTKAKDEVKRAEAECARLTGELDTSEKAKDAAVASDTRNTAALTVLRRQHVQLQTEKASLQAYQTRLTAWGTQMQEIAKAAFPYMQKTVEFYGADYTLDPARRTLKDKGVADPPAPP